MSRSITVLSLDLPLRSLPPVLTDADNGTDPTDASGASDEAGSNQASEPDSAESDDERPPGSQARGDRAEPAEPTGSPAGRWRRRALVGAAVGALVAVVLVLVRYLLRRRSGAVEEQADEDHPDADAAGPMPTDEIAAISEAEPTAAGDRPGGDVAPDRDLSPLVGMALLAAIAAVVRRLESDREARSGDDPRERGGEPAADAASSSPTG